MRKIIGATLAIAAGLAAVGGAASSASALTVAKHPVAVGNSAATQVAWRGDGHHNEWRGQGQHNQWRGNHGGYGHHYGYGHRYNRGGGIVLRFGNSGGGGGCYWLKRRALDTGSRYWWHRYNECRN